MDIIHQCLSLAPVPYLDFAFSVFEFIWTSVEQAQASKQQLHALAQTIAQLLSTLNEEYRAGRLVQAETSTPLADLGGFVILTAPYIPDSYRCPLQQITERYLRFCSERDFTSIYKTSFHQRSTNCSDRSLPQVYQHCSHIFSGELSYLPLYELFTPTEPTDIGFG